MKRWIFAILAILLVPAIMAQTSEDVSDNKCETKWFCNQEIALECQDFYGDSHYYTISKWTYDGSNYALNDQNNLYRYYDTTVVGSLNGIEWTSNPNINSVIVMAGDETLTFDGGISGSINTEKEISHVTFCGYRKSNGGVKANSLMSTSTASNGVPEFPGVAVGAAVLVATLGLVFLRKN